MLSNRHCVPASLQVLPAQQGPPDLPQVAHIDVESPGVLLVQARSALAQLPPVIRVPLGQHGSFRLPHVQRPDWQVP